MPSRFPVERESQQDYSDFLFGGRHARASNGAPPFRESLLECASESQLQCMDPITEWMISVDAAA